MQYGMPTLIENKTLTDNIKLCKELGLNFIELNMNFPEYQIDKLEGITEFYKAADIKIAIENTDGFREYERKAIDYLLDCPCFVLTWDIGHSKATQENDVPFILERKEKLKHFHIHDGSENPPKNHLALGDGEIDVAERLRIAKECNGRCVLETKTIEALQKSVRWIQQKKKIYISD